VAKKEQFLILSFDYVLLWCCALSPFRSPSHKVCTRCGLWSVDVWSVDGLMEPWSTIETSTWAIPSRASLSTP